MTDFTAARSTMVENQLRTYDVTEPSLLAGFGRVPREAFVATGHAAFAYVDRQVTAADGKTILLPPMVLARMIQSLELSPGEKILSVGCAGYAAAIMASMGLSVTALVSDGESARASLTTAGNPHVTVVAGDFGGGVAAQAPFDAILVNGAADLEPVGLLRQLKEDGALAIIMGRGRSGRATVFKKVGNGFSHARAFDAAGPLLPAFEKKPEFVF